MSQPKHAPRPNDELDAYRRLAEKSRFLGSAWETSPPPLKVLAFSVTTVMVLVVFKLAEMAGVLGPGAEVRALMDLFSQLP
jgi:hypothetical protein